MRYPILGNISRDNCAIPFKNKPDKIDLQMVSLQALCDMKEYRSAGPLRCTRACTSNSLETQNRTRFRALLKSVVNNVRVNLRCPKEPSVLKIGWSRMSGRRTSGIGNRAACYRIEKQGTPENSWGGCWEECWGNSGCWAECWQGCCEGGFLREE